MKQILIYNSGGGLGDSIQIIPLILSLKNHFKSSDFYYLSSHENHFVDKLKDYGIQTVNGVANFILAKFKDQIQANSCYSFLEEKGILVRKIGEYGLPEYLRITVGLEDENKILCDEINNFLKLNGK